MIVQKINGIKYLSDIVQRVMEYEEPKDIIKYSRVSTVWNHAINGLLIRYGLSKTVGDLCDSFRVVGIKKAVDKMTSTSLRDYIEPELDFLLASLKIQIQGTKKTLNSSEQKLAQLEKKFCERGHPKMLSNHIMKYPGSFFDHLKRIFKYSINMENSHLIESLFNNTKVSECRDKIMHIYCYRPQAWNTDYFDRCGNVDPLSVNIIEAFKEKNPGMSLRLGISKGADEMGRIFFVFDVLELVRDKMLRTSCIFSQLEKNSKYWVLHGHRINCGDGLYLNPEQTLEMISTLAQGAVFTKSSFYDTIKLQALSNPN